MKQIKASEVKPGMVVEFTLTRKMMIHKNTTFGNHHRKLTDSAGGGAFIGADALVAVLSEPQPEEPTAFGARVTVGDRRSIRLDNGADPWWLQEFGFCTWGDLCTHGLVTIIDADPSWTAPEQTHDTPEVPDRIAEWPEDDTALRNYEWRDRDGRPWLYSKTHGNWYNFSGSAISQMVTEAPKFGPWTRVTDA